jgi:cell shape-determining protein MreC
VRAAGFSHYFPKEAIIGNIEDIELAENGTSYNCKVRLSADMERIHNVVLVRNAALEELQSLSKSIN